MSDCRLPRRPASQSGLAQKAASRVRRRTRRAAAVHSRQGVQGRVVTTRLAPGAMVESRWRLLKMVINLEELYERQLAPLPSEDRLKLIAMLAQGLTKEEVGPQPPLRSLMELHGLGKEIWGSIDAQDYVNRLRSGA